MRVDKYNHDYKPKYLFIRSLFECLFLYSNKLVKSSTVRYVVLFFCDVKFFAAGYFIFFLFMLFYFCGSLPSSYSQLLKKCVFFSKHRYNNFFADDGSVSLIYLLLTSYIFSYKKIINCFYFFVVYIFGDVFFYELFKRETLSFTLNHFNKNRT